MFEKTLQKRQTKHSLIHHEPRNSDSVVVVFSDIIGGSAMWPLTQYTSYVFVQGQLNWHVCTDWEQLSRTIEPYKHITTTGMSMGGAGALLAAHKVRVDRVVSFVPQIDLKSSRWAKWHTEWMSDLEKLQYPVKDVEYKIHTGTMLHDLAQAKLFKGGSHNVWEGCKTHQLCEYLKDKDLLYSTILS